MSNDQYLNAKDLQDIIELIHVLDRRFNPIDGATVCPDDTKLYDSNGELVGTIVFNRDTNSYVFQYPAPEEA